ncbi:MAG: hypothetical protein HRU19_14420 [Pseudobacteriovorax sp.]|nr:hypothetical protein [Pseudobacteriovorax sp.]
MLKKSLVAFLFLISGVSLAAEGWESSVKSVRTCKHPNNNSTMIQIDFENGKSLALSDGDYSEMLFKSYMSTSLSAFASGAKLRVGNANIYSNYYCGNSNGSWGNSTHSGGQVILMIGK